MYGDRSNIISFVPIIMINDLTWYNVLHPNIYPDLLFFPMNASSSTICQCSNFVYILSSVLFYDIMLWISMYFLLIFYGSGCFIYFYFYICKTWFIIHLLYLQCFTKVFRSKINPLTVSLEILYFVILHVFSVVHVLVIVLFSYPSVYNKRYIDVLKNCTYCINIMH